MRVNIKKNTMQKKLNKIFILSDLLIQELDDLKGSEVSKNIKKKANILNTSLLPIIDNFYKSKGVSKTTFYQLVQQKIDYIFNKEYKKAVR